MATTEPSKFRAWEEKEESLGMVLMGVYSRGGTFTMPRLGVDGVLGVFLEF
jgi:hypothetical protein